MARGRKAGTTFENGYKKVQVVCKVLDSAFNTANYWKIRRVTNKPEVADAVKDGVHELFFEVRESRATRLTAALRRLTIGGQKVNASVVGAA